MEFKDLFSAQATDYAKFRPRYPAALFDYLADLAPKRDLALDVGTGNGQAAVELAARFQRVLATDPSQKQLAQAETRPNIDYRRAPAEATEAPAGAVDLVTVAQAFHWFDQPKFFAEVQRVAKPGAVLAAWTYGLAQIEPSLDAVIDQLYRGLLEPYWDPARKLVDQGYKNEKFPFAEISAPKFVMSADWTLPEWMGYLGTWSAVQKYKEVNGKDPLELSWPAMREAWGAEERRRVEWPLGMRVVRVSGS